MSFVSRKWSKQITFIESFNYFENYLYQWKINIHEKNLERKDQVSATQLKWPYFLKQKMGIGFW